MTTVLALAADTLGGGDASFGFREFALSIGAGLVVLAVILVLERLKL